MVLSFHFVCAQLGWYFSSIKALTISVFIFIFSSLILLLSRQKNSRQKAKNVNANVCFIGVEILMPREVINTGCILLHNLMARKVIGTLTNPIIPKTAEKLAR